MNWNSLRNFNRPLIILKRIMCLARGLVLVRKSARKSLECRQFTKDHWDACPALSHNSAREELFQVIPICFSSRFALQKLREMTEKVNVTCTWRTTTNQNGAVQFSSWTVLPTGNTEQAILHLKYSMNTLHFANEYYTAMVWNSGLPYCHLTPLPLPRSTLHSVFQFENSGKKAALFSLHNSSFYRANIASYFCHRKQSNSKPEIGCLTDAISAESFY